MLSFIINRVYPRLCTLSPSVCGSCGKGLSAQPRPCPLGGGFYCLLLHVSPASLSQWCGLTVVFTLPPPNPCLFSLLITSNTFCWLSWPTLKIQRPRIFPFNFWPGLQIDILPHLLCIIVSPIFIWMSTPFVFKLFDTDSEKPLCMS